MRPVSTCRATRDATLLWFSQPVLTCKSPPSPNDPHHIPKPTNQPHPQPNPTRQIRIHQNQARCLSIAPGSLNFFPPSLPNRKNNHHKLQPSSFTIPTKRPIQRANNGRIPNVPPPNRTPTPGPRPLRANPPPQPPRPLPNLQTSRPRTAANMAVFPGAIPPTAGG